MEKVNILMVDDQPSKLLTYEAILGSLDANLIKANSGQEALDHLLRTDVAVVLMDVRMPELDGFEVAEIIRSHPRFQKTAIIFVSADNLTDQEKLKGYRRGAVDYISVPVDPDVLRAKVTVFADLHRQSRQLDRLNRELHTLSSRLMSLQDEERRRVSRELHEGLGQDLVAAMMMVDGMNLREHSIEVNEQARNESKQPHGKYYQESPQHLAYLASSAAGRIRPSLDRGVVFGRPQSAQWYPYVTRCAALRIPSPEARNGNSDFPNHPGSIEQCTQALGSAAGFGLARSRARKRRRECSGRWKRL